jgi:hypothetical protein
LFVAGPRQTENSLFSLVDLYKKDKSQTLALLLYMWMVESCIAGHAEGDPVYDTRALLWLLLWLLAASWSK